MVKGAEAALAGTVTVEGTAATDLLELERLMVIPPEGARPARFTVFAVVDCPPITFTGAKTSELICAASRVTVVLAMIPLTPLRLARIVTVVLVATAPVPMLKLEETVAPAATVTDAGTVAIAGFEVER